MHSPAPTRVTVLPEIAHMPGVDDTNVTARPDVAIAVTANGAVPMTRSAIGENEID